MYIDASNLIIGAKQKGIKRVDFQCIVNEASKDTIRIGTFFYAGDIPTRYSFYRNIEQLGIHVERVAPDKSVDGRLIFDMLIGAYRDSYEVAILGSGDRDYVRVVEEVKRLEKSVWVVAWEHSVNRGLRDIASRFISLDSFSDKIDLDKRAPIKIDPSSPVSSAINPSPQQTE